LPIHHTDSDSTVERSFSAAASGSAVATNLPQRLNDSRFTHASYCTHSQSTGLNFVPYGTHRQSTTARFPPQLSPPQSPVLLTLLRGGKPPAPVWTASSMW